MRLDHIELFLLTIQSTIIRDLKSFAILVVWKYNIRFMILDI